VIDITLMWVVVVLALWDYIVAARRKHAYLR
jgi:hypothetical protein